MKCKPSVFNPAEKIESVTSQVLCSIEQIRQIEIADIVTGDDVRINLTNEIGPFL